MDPASKIPPFPLPKLQDHQKPLGSIFSDAGLQKKFSFGAEQVQIEIHSFLTVTTAEPTSVTVAHPTVPLTCAAPQREIHSAALRGDEDKVRNLIRKKGLLDERDLNGATALHLSIASRHFSIAKLLIESGCDVNAATAHGFTPLHMACEAGLEWLVRLLLQKRCQVDRKLMQGETPLLLACHHGHSHTVKILLESQCDVNSASADGFSPLHIAAASGRLEIARDLIAAKCELNPKTSDGATPLIAAARNGHAEVVQLLLDAGCEVETSTVDGNTPLHLAASAGDPRIVKSLLNKGCDVNTTNNTGITPVHVAVFNDRLPAARLLMRSGCDVSYADDDGITPLHTAAFKNNPHMVREVIRHGGRVDAQTTGGRSPIHVASENGHVGAMRQLLLDGSSDRLVKRAIIAIELIVALLSAFVLAVEEGLAWFVVSLAAAATNLILFQNLTLWKPKLSTGATEHMGKKHDDGGESASSAGFGKKVGQVIPPASVISTDAQKCCEFLFDFSCTLSLVTMASILSHAIKHGVLVSLCLAAATLCIALRRKVWTLPPVAEEEMGPARSGRLTKEVAGYVVLAVPLAVISVSLPRLDYFDCHCHLLLTVIPLIASHGASFAFHLTSRTDAKPKPWKGGEAVSALRLPDSEGLSPIHLAAANGHAEAVALLIECGSDVNSKSNEDVTPIFLAAQNGHVGVVDLLVQHRCDVNAGTQLGITPLHSAAIGGHRAVVEKLISSGASLNAQSYEGATPLHVTIAENQLSVAKLLLTSKCDPDVPDKRGYTPLHLAVILRNLDAVKTILASKCNVDKTDHNGETALHMAAKNDVAGVKELIAAKCNVKAQTRAGQTALHFAAYFGHHDIAKALIEAGADVNAQDADGSTSMHLAAQHGRTKVARLLAASGCDVQLRNGRGELPAQTAHHHGHKQIVKILEETRAPRRSSTTEKREKHQQLKRSSSAPKSAVAALEPGEGGAAAEPGDGATQEPRGEGTRASTAVTDDGGDEVFPRTLPRAAAPPCNLRELMARAESDEAADVLRELDGLPGEAAGYRAVVASWLAAEDAPRCREDLVRTALLRGHAEPVFEDARALARELGLRRFLSFADSPAVQERQEVPVAAEVAVPPSAVPREVAVTSLDAGAGRLVVLGCEDGSVAALGLAGEAQAVARLDGPLLLVHLLAGGRACAAVTREAVVLFDLAPGLPIAEHHDLFPGPLPGPHDGVRAACGAAGLLWILTSAHGAAQLLCLDAGAGGLTERRCWSCAEDFHFLCVAPDGRSAAASAYGTRPELFRLAGDAPARLDPRGCALGLLEGPARALVHDGEDVLLVGAAGDGWEESRRVARAPGLAPKDALLAGERLLLLQNDACRCCDLASGAAHEFLLEAPLRGRCRTFADRDRLFLANAALLRSGHRVLVFALDAVAHPPTRLAALPRDALRDDAGAVLAVAWAAPARDFLALVRAGTSLRLRLLRQRRLLASVGDWGSARALLALGGSEVALARENGPQVTRYELAPGGRLTGVRKLAVGGAVSALAFSSEGRLVAASALPGPRGQYAVRRWDGAQWRHLAAVDDCPTSLAVCEPSAAVLCETEAGGRRQLGLWRPHDGPATPAAQQTVAGVPHHVYRVSPDGEMVAMTTEAGALRAWRLRSASVALCSDEPPGTSHTFCFDPGTGDLVRLSFGDGGPLRLTVFADRGEGSL